MPTRTLRTAHARTKKLLLAERLFMFRTQLRELLARSVERALERGDPMGETRRERLLVACRELLGCECRRTQPLGAIGGGALGGGALGGGAIGGELSALSVERSVLIPAETPDRLARWASSAPALALTSSSSFAASILTARVREASSTFRCVCRSLSISSSRSDRLAR